MYKQRKRNDNYLYCIIIAAFENMICKFMVKKNESVENTGMYFICNRIKMIDIGTNPYFVKELETGYVVIGDNQYFIGYRFFLCK